MTATIQESAAPSRASQPPQTVPVTGIIDLGDGHALVRTSGYRASPADVYVSAGQIRQYGLRKGDHIEGTARPNGTSPNGTGPNGTGRGKFNPLARVDTVNGM